MIRRQLMMDMNRDRSEESRSDRSNRETRARLPLVVVSASHEFLGYDDESAGGSQPVVKNNIELEPRFKSKDVSSVIELVVPTCSTECVRLVATSG